MDVKLALHDYLPNKFVQFLFCWERDLGKYVPSDSFTLSVPLDELAHRGVAAELEILTPLTGTNLLPRLIEPLLLFSASVLCGLLHGSIIFTPKLLLKDFDEPFPQTFFVVISFVLTIKVGFTAFLFEYPVLLDTKLIRNTVFQHLKNLK